MLKSTHRPSAPSPADSPLPSGWTEHKAPTGHTYYYNAELKQSTYTRPSIPSDEPLQIDYGATEPDHVVRASMQALEEFHRNTTAPPGHFTGGRSYQEHSRRRGNQGDRPKTKAAIPNYAPWILVKTKLGRRFVHNTETKQSLWKFPQDVMMAVIEMDRLEWETKKKAESEAQDDDREQEKGQAGDTPNSEISAERTPAVGQRDHDSDSYEEVEVTDDEAEDDEAAKRPRFPHDHETGTPPPTGPVEFDEDDIAYQLAAMEEDYEDSPQSQNGGGEDDEEGLPLTKADNIALFRSLLDDSGISPYSTFEKLIEDSALVEDPRYVALPNTSSRKEAFASWSKDRIAELQTLKQQSGQQSKGKNPKIQYLRFLQQHATPKLYWPEFRRKFKKENEMRDLSIPDKEREKLYREYIAKVKLGESERRKELVALLKTVQKGEDVRRDMEVDDLPESVLKDLRFYILEERRRDELVRAFLQTF